jgi:hypothetical protein
MDIARKVLPADDSSLQWSPMGSGRALNPALELEKLYDRMVMRYDDHSTPSRRSEEDVWRHFKNDLEAKRLLEHFQPTRIAVKDDEVEFKHTWKNGVFHCLEAVSFDLSTPDSIKDKAHKWLGRVTSIADAKDEFRLYFLVGEPSDKSLKPAYEKAMSILSKVPVENRIFQENQTKELADLFEREVATHEGRLH